MVVLKNSYSMISLCEPQLCAPPPSRLSTGLTPLKPCLLSLLCSIAEFLAAAVNKKKIVRKGNFQGVNTHVLSEPLCRSNSRLPRWS